MSSASPLTVPVESDRYEQLVAELERMARADPRRLRRRVRWLIACGYAYVLLVLVLMLGALAALVWLLLRLHGAGLMFKVTVPLIAVIGVIGKSLWITVRAPGGEPLARGSAPVLDERVEEIRRRLDAPRADAVLLTDDFNASVTQVPRLGIFGLPKTYLSLGLPLMLSLDRRQFDAVLSHEFAHLSGAHPKLGLWVYRMSGTWNQLLAQLEAKRSWGQKLFAPFIRWYAPRMRAYGFVLSHRDEYEADADAARVTSPRDLGDALIALEVGNRALTEHFWPELWKRAQEEPEPPAESWSRMRTAIREGIPDATRAAWLKRAMARSASDDDTHPSLHDRLHALGIQDPELVDVLETHARVGEVPEYESAAQHYLGGIVDERMSELDAAWLQSVAETWKERHEEGQRQRALLRELNERAAAGESLGVEDLWQRALAEVDIVGRQASIASLRELLVAAPGHFHARFVLGRLLLVEHDESGVGHLHQVMEQTSEYTLRCIMALKEFFADVGRRDDVTAMSRLERRQLEVLELATEERSDVRKGDTLLRVEPDHECVERLRTMASEDERISAAWIARKQVEHLTDAPMFVVLVEPKWWRVGSVSVNDGKLAREVLEGIEVEARVQLLVILVSSSSTWLKKKMEAVEASCVFDRGQESAGSAS